MFAVRDNIDRIVSSAYRQGMSDGQRNVVSEAANISTASPNTQGMPQQENPLGAQVNRSCAEEAVSLLETSNTKKLWLISDQLPVLTALPQ